MAKNLRKKRNKRRSKPTATIPIQPPPSTKRNWISKYYSRGWKIFLAIAAVGGFVTTIFFFNDLFKTPHQKQKESGLFHGLLVPVSFVPDSTLIIRAASLNISYSVEDLKGGVDFRPHSLLTEDGEPIINISLKLLNNRLYTTIVLTDLNNQYIGKIVDDHFDFTLDPDKYDWDQGSDFIEIVDGEKNTIFQMKYEPPNIYNIQGYFMHKNSVTFLTNSLRHLHFSTPGWADSVRREMKNISHFSSRWKDGYNPY
jgi:hypothetical protein